MQGENYVKPICLHWIKINFISIIIICDIFTLLLNNYLMFDVRLYSDWSNGIKIDGKFFVFHMENANFLIACL